MKVKINSRDLTVGMYVCELDRPWRETPFLFQGFEIRNDEDLHTVQKYCREVTVLLDDVVIGRMPGRELRRSRSSAGRRVVAMEFEQDLLKLNNHPTARSIYQDQTTLEEEIELVKGVYIEARQLTAQLLDDVRLARSLDGVVVRRAVNRLAESVLRNPDALTCYAQLKRKSSYESLHGLRSCILTLIFGRQLGLARERLEIFGMAGLLHDIGMVKVPDEILDKPEPLTPVETAIVRRHVRWGVEMLERSPGMPAAVLEAAQNHHEHYDGSGYLRGLKADAIGEAGLVVGIVDSYDAITNERAHRGAGSPYLALRALYENRGSLFHPTLVERFIQCLGVYPVGSVVELNTGEIGVVVALNRSSRLKPRVALARQADRTPYAVTPVVNLGARRDADGVPCEVERVLDPASAQVDPVRYLPISAAA